MSERTLEDVWRHEAPHVLGALLRKFGDFDGCEDACQEAVAVAAKEWPLDGQPRNPRAWLIRVASRRLIDSWRSDTSRAERERLVGIRNPADVLTTPGPDAPSAGTTDDTLQLLMLCCHPVLTKTSQVALTLRAVGGLSTDQVASALLVPTATMAQRISRAKATLREAGARFDDTSADERRVSAVLHVLYLIFNEGYATSGGDHLVDVSLTREAIRLTRLLRSRIPADSETGGLLALMLLTDARSYARTDDNGDLIPLSEQDRVRWDQRAIREGVALLEQVLPGGGAGPFQLQAAIAAVHAEAPTWEDTDWRQIVVLYRMLDRVAPSPTVMLNLGVAVGMVDGPEAGLEVVAATGEEPSMRRNHRLHAVRGHLLELAGRVDEAVESFGTAARLTSSVPEQRYLNRQVARLTGE